MAKQLVKCIASNNPALFEVGEIYYTSNDGEYVHSRSCYPYGLTSGMWHESSYLEAKFESFEAE